MGVKPGICASKIEFRPQSWDLCLTDGIRDSDISWEKNQKPFFDFLSSGLGINVSLFRLRQFGKVESELGSRHGGG